MARRALGPGETGAITYHGKHPETGRWTRESKLKEEGLRPKLWRASVRYHDPDRRKVRELTAQGATKSKALDALNQAIRSAKDAEGVDLERARVTVGQATLAYIRSVESGELGHARRTRESYGYMARRWILGDDSPIRDRRIVDIKPLALQQDMERISRAGAHAQIRTYKAVLNAVFARAVAAELIPHNPLLLAKAPRKSLAAPRVPKNGAVRRRNRALALWERELVLERLEGYGDPLLRDLVHVMLSMGLRISEAFSLRRQDVDFENDRLSVVGQLVWVYHQGSFWEEILKSDLSYRTLPLREMAKEALLRRADVKVEGEWSEFLFAEPDGREPRKYDLEYRMRCFFDAVGLKDCSSHVFRRTVERELELAGATVSEREVFMGHTEEIARRHYADHGTVRRSIARDLDALSQKTE